MLTTFFASVWLRAHTRIHAEHVLRMSCVCTAYVLNVLRMYCKCPAYVLRILAAYVLRMCCVCAAYVLHMCCVCAVCVLCVYCVCAAYVLRVCCVCAALPVEYSALSQYINQAHIIVPVLPLPPLQCTAITLSLSCARNPRKIIVWGGGGGGQSQEVHQVHLNFT